MSPALDPATHERLVRLAMREAGKAADRGDPPFGAVLADAGGRVLARARNTQLSRRDPTAHAEVKLIRVAARRLGLATLDGLVLASNAEPCSMCLSALVKSRIGVVISGAPHEPHIDPPLPADEIVRRSHHHVELVAGILADECSAQIAAARAVNLAPD
jgi:tRNA(adenine34) deaminase